MSNVIHLLTTVGLMSWLCTAIAWGAAGWAAASWGRRPWWLGVVCSAVFPVVGLLVLLPLLLGGRRNGVSPGVVGQDSPSATNWAPSWSGIAAMPGQILDGGGAPVSPPMSNGWRAADRYRDSPFAAVPAEIGPLPPVAASAGGARPTRVEHRVILGGLALVIGAATFALLFVGNWIRARVNAEVGYTLDAWDLGIGEMILVTVVEFVLLGVVCRQWRSRWPGVLAVFAGTWWFLLWYVGHVAGGGARQLARESHRVHELSRAGLSLGWVWWLVLILAVGMFGWGISAIRWANQDATIRRSNG